MNEGTGFTEELVERAPVVFFRRSAALDRITYISPNSDRVLGYPPFEIEATAGFWDGRVHEEDLRWYQRGLETLTDGEQTEGEYRFVRRGGVPIWLHCIEYAERDGAGALLGTLGYATDVTDRMTVLAVLRGAHAEMKGLNSDLTEARDAAETANKAKSEFLTGMSHEIRTPLNAILGFAQLLAMAGLGGEQREGVDEILKGGRHLLSLVGEVLDIARIEAGSLPLSMEPVSVQEVCDECVALVRPLAWDNQLTITGPAVDDNRFLMADRQRVKQVLLNLLSNAIKYNRPRGSVELEVETEDGHVTINVVDTGMGIPRDKMAALFKPFERLGAEQTDIEGTGLGLALSRRLVEAMKGRITVSSRPGRGSTFSVRLEIVDAPAKTSTRARRPRAQGSRRELPERRIIYVEDNLSNLKLVERILERRPSIELHAALQGRLGLDLIRQHQPDLVLLDLNLADIDGLQVLDGLKAEPGTAAIPVVVISADATDKRVEQLRAAGARDYLTKPLDVARFLMVLDGILWPAGVEDVRQRPG